jgi:hypothetical protein
VVVFERVFYDASENQSVLFLPRDENRHFSTHGSGKKNQQFTYLFRARIGAIFTKNNRYDLTASAPFIVVA